jgi:hypothetical protein
MIFFLEFRTVRVNLHVVFRDGVRRFLPLIEHPPVTLYVFVPVLENEISDVSDFCVLCRTVFVAVAAFGAAGVTTTGVTSFLDLKTIVGFGDE